MWVMQCLRRTTYSEGDSMLACNAHSCGTGRAAFRFSREGGISDHPVQRMYWPLPG